MVDHTTDGILSRYRYRSRGVHDRRVGGAGNARPTVGYPATASSALAAGVRIGPDMTAAPSSLSQAPVRPDLVIDWMIPAQRPGWRGALSRFLGPGQTPADILVLIGGFIVCAALLTVCVELSSSTFTAALTWWQVLVVEVVGYDLIGGVVTNATGAAKRWYHRPGTRRHRLAFTTVHLTYLLAIALLVLHLDWAWLGVNVAILLSGACAIEAVPLALRRPLAVGWVLMAILLNQILVPSPPCSSGSYRSSSSSS